MSEWFSEEVWRALSWSRLGYNGGFALINFLFAYMSFWVEFVVDEETGQVQARKRQDRSIPHWLTGGLFFGIGLNAMGESLTFLFAPWFTLGYLLSNFIGRSPFYIGLALILIAWKAGFESFKPLLTAEYELRKQAREAERREAEAYAQAAKLRALNEQLDLANHGLKQGNAKLRKTKENLEYSNTQLKHTTTQLKRYIDTISHDVRTPVTTILGFLDLAKADLGTMIAEGKLTEDAQLVTDFDFIASAAHTADEIIQGLDEYNTVASGDMPTMDEIDTFKLVDRLAKALHGLAEGAVILYEADELPNIYASHLVGQVFQNVMANALKYRHPERPPVIEIKGRLIDHGMIEFCVSDNGLGFKQVDEEKIFTIFRSAHDDKMGRGIGLSIARDIVEAHGGDIWAEGEEGQGASFYFTLPQGEFDVGGIHGEDSSG